MTGKSGWNDLKLKRPDGFSTVYTIFGNRKLIRNEHGLSERLLELYEGKKKMVAYPYDHNLFAAWPSDCF